MTAPISLEGRNLLPPDPFANDVGPHPQPPVATDRALLPPDPFETLDYGRTAHSMAATLSARTVTPSVAQHLDATRDAYSGPYQILGQTVLAVPHFRMGGGENQTTLFTSNSPDQSSAAAFKSSLTARGREVYRILERAGVGNPGGVMLGYGSPSALVKATQVLYFAGKLPSLPAPATLADRVRQMQWDNGIGVDCVDYTMTALAHTKGRSIDGIGLRPGVDPFGQAGDVTPAHFTRVGALAVRAGDVMTLKDADPKEVGHRVIVRDHTVLAATDTKRAEIAQRWGSVASTFLKGTGPFHVYAVDSSWGAGNGNSYGGFRTDTWVHSESSGLWMSFSPHENRVLVSADGPAGEKFVSGYRYGAS